MSSSPSSLPLVYPVALALTNAYFLICLFVFWSFRREEGMRMRLPIFVCFSMLANMVCGNMFLTLLINHYVPLVGLNIPPTELWIDYLFIPSWLYCNILRDIYLVFRRYLNVLPLMDKDGRGGIVADIQVSNSIIGPLDRMIIAIAIFFQRLLRKKIHKEARTNTTDMLGKYATLNSWDLVKLLLALYLLTIIVLIISVLATGCGFSPSSMGSSDPISFPLYAYVALYLLLKPLFVYSLRKFEDPYGMVFETTIQYLNILVLFILFFFIQPETIFSFSMTILNGFICLIYPVIHLKVSQRTCKNLLLKYDQESLLLAINTPDLYAKLKATMSTMYCIENALFLDQVKAAKSLAAGNADSKIMTDALYAILFKFIKQGSVNELNISDELRKRFMDLLLLAAGGKKLQQQPLETKVIKDALLVLDEIHQQVMYMVFENSFPRYLQEHGKSIAKVSQISNDHS